MCRRSPGDLRCGVLPTQEGEPLSAFSTAGLARITSRNPWKVVIVWIIIFALGGWSASMIGDRVVTDFTFYSKPESIQGQDLLEQHFGTQALTETIVISSVGLTVDDPQFQSVVTNVMTGLRAIPDVINTDPAKTFSYLDLASSADPNVQAAANNLISQDRHATLIPVTTTSDEYPDTDLTDAYLKALSSSATADVRVLPVGAISIGETFNKISEEDLQTGEGIGVGAALIILLIVFGALVAVGLPLVLALMSIAIATGIVSVIATFSDISFFVTSMISMIGLAVGIDYALFIVERYREERRHGRAKLDAIEMAGSTASKAVLFSGLTVIFALIGLFIIPTTIFRSLGLGAVVVVAVAVCAMLTLVPAMLALLGDKIDWPRKRHYDDPDRIAAQLKRDTETVHSGFWGTIARVVMARPVVSMIAAGGLLILLAIPYFDLNTGFNGPSTLPSSDSKDGYNILANNQFGNEQSVGRLSPIKIAIDGAKDKVQPGLDRLYATLSANPDLANYSQATWDESGTAAEIEVNVNGDSDSALVRGAVHELRDTILPQSFVDTGAKTYVTGDPAINVDFQRLVDVWTPRVFIFVLALSFILLTLAFRSIVVPAKAIVMNLLGVGAAYGILTLVFEKGYLHNVFGFEKTPQVEPWLPIFLFCVLFGLSMDYHVFLLSRIREHYDLTGNNRESVAYGLQSTARIITGAALIMVSVFFGFAVGRLVMFQQMGFGLGMAVLLDATVIRSILVPSAMVLLGDRNWYMPKWLNWLPDLRVEGAPRHMPPTDVAVNPTGD
jgi:putative drug exporter of the RND superfamily